MNTIKLQSQPDPLAILREDVYTNDEINCMTGSMIRKQYLKENTINPMEKTLVISGQSGSGKTTLLNAIAAMYKPEEVAKATSILPKGFQADTENTKLIIFDEIPTQEEIIDLHKAVRVIFKKSKLIFATQDQCITIGDNSEFSVVHLYSTGR